MLRFTIRDVLWLTLVVGLAVGWWVDRQRRPPPSVSGLYTDGEALGVIERWSAHHPGDETLLQVVPFGTEAPLSTVFGALGFDLGRLGTPTEMGANNVVFLTWQLSPTYQLSCMTNVDDPENSGAGYTDPKRPLYGIRIKRLPGAPSVDASQ